MFNNIDNVSGFGTLCLKTSKSGDPYFYATKRHTTTKFKNCGWRDSQSDLRRRLTVCVVRSLLRYLSLSKKKKNWKNLIERRKEFMSSFGSLHWKQKKWSNWILTPLKIQTFKTYTCKVSDLKILSVSTASCYCVSVIESRHKEMNLNKRFLLIPLVTKKTFGLSRKLS